MNSPTFDLGAAVQEANDQYGAFDFDIALSILEMVQARLQCRYELDRHEQYADLEYHFGKLKKCLETAEEPIVDPRAGEDEFLDDNRRW